MALFKKPYNLEDDIAQTREVLRRIAMLEELTRFPAWHDVDALFRQVIGAFTDEMMALCSDPKKNDVEIRCKRMVAEALTSLLATINNKVESREQLQKNLEDKVRSRVNLNQPII